MTLDFAQKKVFGNGPCSKYYGTLRDLDKNRVRFENIGNTKANCNFSDKEKVFFDLLPLTQNFTIEGERMFVYHGTELILAFKRK
jgi:heat shock protein HslJ